MKKLLAITVAAFALTACFGGPMGPGHWDRDERAAMFNKDHVVLINTFEVPAGKEAAVREDWQKARDFLAAQPGFINTRLHQNLDPSGKFLFINVAKWRSAEEFKAVTAKMRAQGLSMPEGTKATPALYRVVSE